MVKQVNPFDPNSPIKQSAISYFPPDMFFVLRVVQLLRGLANGEWRGSTPVVVCWLALHNLCFFASQCIAVTAQSCAV